MSESSDPLIGKVIGNYLLLDLIGKGGFANVYLGTHIRLQKKATIKILHVTLSKDKIASFLREAQTIAQLEHPNIMQILDFDVTKDQTPFLIMQYVQGGSLKQVHSLGTKLPPKEILKYVKLVAEALQHAHDQEIVHPEILNQRIF